MNQREISSHRIPKKRFLRYLVAACVVLILLGFALGRIWQGESKEDTYSDISDSRVKQCLPPGSSDIFLQKELGGHFAHYKVSETDFHEFLDAQWKAKRNSSAHERNEMHREGEPMNQERLAKRFESLGWDPPKNAIMYYSPSKSSGAMTTYYYGREAGIVYHDTGYW